MKRSDAEHSRHTIIRIARKLFMKEGPQVTLSDIIKHSGLSRITFYRHFSSKTDLIHGIFERNLDMLTWYAKRLECDERGFEKLLLVTANMHMYFHELSLYLHDPGKTFLLRLLAIFKPLAECALKSKKIRSDFNVDKDLTLLIMMISGAIVFSSDNEKEKDLQRAYQILLEGIRR
ncbi:TetR/AcrR family transcriptional regulator [Thermaurantimonas aggregans]|uniref:TetR/AcrR family transcriptional regulator n=1 Tax=Thermaurantimonas aggregans TaxID=2173829 RepID=UPI0023F58FCB|nr:TetR/AcrR family transcriptional regulator [Thermaurantimonas aggregans]MCX8149634.1 TetR/AcrR family transcriptional regulator [Thermaurantimonas aggregans]